MQKPIALRNDYGARIPSRIFTRIPTLIKSLASKRSLSWVSKNVLGVCVSVFTHMSTKGESQQLARITQLIQMISLLVIRVKQAGA